MAKEKIDYIESQSWVIKVIKKPIKRVYIRYQPHSLGVWQVSVPLNYSMEVLKNLVNEKRKKLEQFLAQANLKTPPIATFSSGETHLLWGKPHILQVHPTYSKKIACLLNDTATIALYIPIREGVEGRKALFEAFLKEQIEKHIPILKKEWETVIGKQAQEVVIKAMKSRWGVCRPRSGRVTLNAYLAQGDPCLLVYVWVHELVHFWEKSHNKRFYALMDRFLPDWKESEQLLKSLPTALLSVSVD